jgi:hypothetical protein
MKTQWYVGHKTNGELVAFGDTSEPTVQGYGKLFGAVIGPFKTKRGALWVEKYGRSNPHFQHVNDAERLAKL